jgi:hypothetical protein
MTQPLGSGAPVPVSGVTGGPGLPQGVASVDGGTGNVIISPPSNTIEQKKTDAPQALLVYEFFHSNTDFVRVGLQTQTNGPEFIGVTVAPSGVLRDLVVGTSGNLRFAPGSGVTWIMDNTGLLYPNNNGLTDLGGSGANIRNIITRQLNLYSSTGVIASSLFSGTGVPAVGLGVNGDIYFNLSGAALTTMYQKRAGAWVGIV